MKKVLFGLLLPMVCLIVGSCEKTIYCAPFPQEIIDYFPQMNGPVLYSNGSDTIAITNKVRNDSEESFEAELGTKATCLRVLSLHYTCAEIDSDCSAIREKCYISLNFDIWGKGKYHKKLSDDMELNLSLCDLNTHSDYYVEHSYPLKVASDRMSLEESPWDDTVTFCFPEILYDSICFVKNEGLISFHDRQDNTTWHRIETPEKSKQ